MPTGVYKRTIIKTTEQFVQEAQAVHGDRFDYSKTDYTGSGCKVLIRCKEHDVEFYGHSGNHLKGSVNCPECTRQKKINQKKIFKNIVKVGDKKDQLTVINGPYRKLNKNGDPHYWVDLQCDCGKKISMLKDNFLKSYVKGCGCVAKKTLEKKTSKRINSLVGKRYGKLTILKDLGVLKDKTDRQRQCLVQCACGREPFAARVTAVTTGNTTSCYVCRTRWKWKEMQSLENQVFGKLTVLKEWGSTKAHAQLSMCQCECGNQSIIQNNNLMSGNTTRCVECKPQFGDSVEKYLEDTERANSDCYVYIANINGHYIKPGIAKDVEARADDFYTGINFTSPKLSRCEAWAIEQTLLKETTDAKPDALPEMYSEWVGKTELRLKDVYPPEWFEHRFCELLGELQSTGCWLTFYENNN